MWTEQAWGTQDPLCAWVRTDFSDADTRTFVFNASTTPRQLHEAKILHYGPSSEGLPFTEKVHVFAHGPMRGPILRDIWGSEHERLNAIAAHAQAQTQTEESKEESKSDL